MTDDVRRRLFLGCLNREFDVVLAETRKIPTREMDYNFLQVYLSRSVQWGHVDSVDFIWHKYVMRNPILLIKPEILCQMSNLCLYADRRFIPEQIYSYFDKVYRGHIEEEEYLNWKFELLRSKVEAFARGTGMKTEFSEKWKVFLEDIENELPKNVVYRIRDFPHLTKGVKTKKDRDTLQDLLFTDDRRITIKNSSTLPLLLNILLLQSEIYLSDKLSLFMKFFESHTSLLFDDSVAILLKLCREQGQNSYEFAQLTSYIRQHGSQLSTAKLANREVR
ncbi:hypothetical protein KAFR_0B02390 [Kazachstania africana CBS 2517]|uniref:Uncharacterized protein n=1 Tax=Kazachstania africana (strain ATCC 22294 / BCRC 22015 / CBS 2517 / CECT 1963 / NBRC 1671 / NRRL Y-8276) TaxID=1071382 RepID=H2AQ87_KAZAF|nr:hypothetical protein KAFR_0B02390 [Kazachstania africana CBS 2517]CCF56537.1 hypothetical protein KAFR_0B02390 [Kazachstania africana CBS 2517]